MNKDIVDASGRPINVPTINEVQPEEIPIEERGLQLPDPRGYRILCAIPEASETFNRCVICS
jgi:hypothetical protein